MADAAQRELAAARVTDTPGVLLADAGYWHHQQMEHIIDRGIKVLIPPDASRRKSPRPGWDGGYYATCDGATAEHADASPTNTIGLRYPASRGGTRSTRVRRV